MAPESGRDLFRDGPEEEDLRRDDSGVEDPEEILRQDPALGADLKALFQGLEASVAARPRQLGDYRLVREIGSGGMAVVYEAEQVSLAGRRVALKVLSPHLSLLPHSVLRFQREAEAGGRLSHPGIVATYGVGECAGVHYIAQELVQGSDTLAAELERLRSGERLGGEVFRAAAERIALVADALGHAHGHDVIHRDVKPSNILLERDGTPKVGDFGLARVEDATHLSRSGEFIGTPFYMSPEQVVSKRSAIDHRTDIYSLGVTLYEVLTLVRPFEGESSAEVVKKILLQEPRHPHRINARVPKDLAAICLKAMEKEPRRRYQNMAKFARDLLRFHGGEAVLARPVGRIGRTVRWVQRHRLASTAAAALIIAAVALFVLALQFASQRRESRRLAEARYGPLEDTFGYGLVTLQSTVANTCRDIDPGDPSPRVLTAVYSLRGAKLDLAEASVEELLAACKERGEHDLARDAHYLMGLTRLLQARESPPPEAALLLEEVRGELELAGAFDPVSDRQLFWRELTPAAVHATTPVDVYGLRMDGEHYLAHLYLGISIYGQLYLGGDRKRFEKAIESFENVLVDRPDHYIALTCLGRTYFFFARTFGYLHLLDPAREHLERAAIVPPARAYQMAPTTLGQLWLLYGDEDEALRWFEVARALLDRRQLDANSHNVYKGLGLAYLAKGDRSAAETKLNEARKLSSEDPHVNVALMEFHLAHNNGEALIYAEKATGMANGGNTRLAKGAHVASTVLGRVRVHLAMKETSKAMSSLSTLAYGSISCPTAYSGGCRILAAFTEEELALKAGDENGIDIAAELGSHLGIVNHAFLGLESADCYGGRGAALFVQGRYEEAAHDLREALHVRDQWKEDLRDHHWHESAIDLYILAMAQCRQAQDEGKGVDRESECWVSFRKAEELVANHPPLYVGGDILDRVSRRAHEVLDVH